MFLCVRVYVRVCVCVSLYLLSPSGSARLSPQSPSVIVWRVSMICAVLCLFLWEGGRGWRVLLQISGCALLLTDPAHLAPVLCYWLSVSQTNVFSAPAQHVAAHGCAQTHLIPSVLHRWLTKAKNQIKNIEKNMSILWCRRILVGICFGICKCCSSFFDPLERLSERLSVNGSSQQCRVAAEL